MNPIRLEFPVTGHAPVRWLAGNRARGHSAFALGLLALGLAAAAATGWEIWVNRACLAAARDALDAAQIANGQSRASVKAVLPAMNAQQRTRWAQLARQLNTPWSSLLDALETTLPDDVSLVSIEPDGAHGSVRIQAEAKALDSLLAYAGALKSNDLFAKVVLIKHETNDQDPNHPLRLSLDVRLKSSAPPSAPTAEVAR